MNNRSITALVLPLALIISGFSLADQSPAISGANYSQQRAMQLFSQINPTNWAAEGGELSRFAYLNTSQFFRSATIVRAGAVSELEYALDTNLGQITLETNYGKLSLDQWVTDHMDGFLVIRKGEIVYERYPRMRPLDKHIWWSISKSVAGTIIGLLEEQKLLDISKPIEAYLPQLRGTDWAGTPVIDILDMASGMTGLELDDPEAYTNPESPYGLYESSLGIQPNTKHTNFSTYDYVASLQRQKTSGQKYEYTSVNTFVLGWIAETLTDKPYAQLISDMFWQNMGAEADASIVVSPAGAACSHGCISSTLRDLGRYGMLLTPSWNKVADKPVVPPALIEKIQTTGRPGLLRTGLLAPILDDYLGETVHTETRQWDAILSDGDFGKLGFHGQSLYISPGKDLVVASFATGKGHDSWRYARAIAKSMK